MKPFQSADNVDEGTVQDVGFGLKLYGFLNETSPFQRNILLHEALCFCYKIVFTRCSF